MNKKMNELVGFTNELIGIFSDYAYKLDFYFRDEEMQVKHKELYIEYSLLKEGMLKSVRKYKGR